MRPSFENVWYAEMGLTGQRFGEHLTVNFTVTKESNDEIRIRTSFEWCYPYDGWLL